MNHLARLQLLFYSFLLFNSFTASALNEFGGDWNGQLTPSDHSNPIRLTITFTHSGNTLKGPARLEWWDGTFIAFSIINGTITNSVYDPNTGKLNEGDIAFDLPPTADSGTVSNRTPWLGLHFSGRITTKNNGYELAGTWNSGRFYLRKGNTIAQILTDVVSRKLTEYLKRDTYESDSIYQARTTQHIIDSLSDTTAAIFFREWVESNPIRVAYNRPTETFTIDPIITDSFKVKVSLEDAKCFEDQFPGWAIQFLRFRWNKANQKAEVKSFQYKFKCLKARKKKMKKIEVQVNYQ